MKMKDLLHDFTQPVMRTEPPRESLGEPRGSKDSLRSSDSLRSRSDWTDVGIMQLANFFLKCWLANLLVAAVFGIIGFAVWIVLLKGLMGR
jgi:hypothetical protein